MPRKSSIFTSSAREDPQEEALEEIKKPTTVRTGYANVMKSSEQIGRNTSSMAVKQHKKHQVVDTYFSAKVEEMQEREKWAQAIQEGVGLLDGDVIV
jgi:hypothetical protein